MLVYHITREKTTQAMRVKLEMRLWPMKKPPKLLTIMSKFAMLLTINTEKTF